MINVTKLILQVRDIYDAGDYLVLITTDRLSAFDRNLASIPFKGQVCVAGEYSSLIVINLCCLTLTFRFLTRQVYGGSITHNI